MMRNTFVLFAFALSVVIAAEKTSMNSTAGITKTNDLRGKRNSNLLGNHEARRRNDGYNYQPSGYNYEPNNYNSGGSSPSANDFSSQYPEPLEPIIEIIIQDNNETLPEPQPSYQTGGKKKKEQVQVFYVKYHKDEKTGLVIHDPIPALTPLGHQQDDEEYEDEQPYIVTPRPQSLQKSTTLRTIIRPDSMQYESNSGVHVTFGSPHNHHSKSDNQVHDEVKLESAIRPVVQLPQSRIGPVNSIKEKRAQPNGPAHPSGRIVNGPPVNFHQPPLAQTQSNFVGPQAHGHLSHHLSLPSQDPSKPFHSSSPHFQTASQPQFLSNPNQHHQQVNQNVQGHQQQFNQQPQRVPQAQVLSHQQQHQQSQQHQLSQQHQVLRPPQRAPVAANFNQQQRPFNYHAHQLSQQNQQVRFPSQPPQAQQQFQNPPQNFQQSSPQKLQGQPQLLPPRQGPAASFNQQQLPPLNRPAQQFNARPFPSSQKFPQNQGPPPNFRPNTEHIPIPAQPTHQPHQVTNNQQVDHSQTGNQNIFRGGLVQQVAPDLTNNQHRQQHQQHQQQHQHQQHQQQNQQSFGSHDDTFQQEQHNFIQNSFGTDVQVHSSVPKFEHHITETINAPIFFNPTAIDMDKLNHEKAQFSSHSQNENFNTQQQGSQHRFSVNQHNHPQQLGVSNHFSEVFPQIESNQKQQQHSSFLELNGRNNFAPESKVQSQFVQPTPPVTTTKKPETPTTKKPSPSTTKQPQTYDLPDEVPDDLRQQLLSSGILENAQISVLDYDKIGDTSLQDLPAEHLANFFNAGGGTQIGASNKVISVLKPNGDSIDERIKTFANDKELSKLLDGAEKLPIKKDVNLKVLKFNSEKDSHEPSDNINQNNYNRYLPLKIKGGQFPIPDVEELHGKKITSVVVLAPVNGDDGESTAESSKSAMFVAGDSLKNLLRKPSAEHFKKWLEKELKTKPELQSVVLLVTKDVITNEQEIFMYDVGTKAVNRLSGSLSSSFVDVAEENIFDEETSPLNPIDRIDQESAEEDSEAEPSEVVESVVSLDSKPILLDDDEHKIIISSGYSVIKNE